MGKKSKICGKCGFKKDIEDFEIRSDTGKPRGQCKKCISESRRLYREKYKDGISERKKRYSKNNSSKIREKNKQYYANNKENILKQKREYYKNNKQEIARKKLEYERAKYHNDLEYKIAHLLRARIRRCVKNNIHGNSKLDLIGCTIEHLKEYLEKQFEPGMTWKNHGEWHIDHIVPLSAFDLTKKDHVIFACHYTNLQPLWAEDNLSKGAKLDWEKTNAN